MSESETKSPDLVKDETFSALASRSASSVTIVIPRLFCLQNNITAGDIIKLKLIGFIKKCEGGKKHGKGKN